MTFFIQGDAALAFHFRLLLPLVYITSHSQQDRISNSGHLFVSRITGVIAGYISTGCNVTAVPFPN